MARMASMLAVCQLALLGYAYCDADCDFAQAPALLQSSKQTRSGEGDEVRSLESQLAKADSEAAETHFLKLLTEEQKVQAQNLEKVVGQQAGLAAFQADKFAALQETLDAQEKKIEAEEKNMKQLVKDVTQQFDKLAKEYTKKKEEEEYTKKKEEEAALPPNFEDVSLSQENMSPKKKKTARLDSTVAEPEASGGESKAKVEQEHWYSSSWVKTVAGIGLLGLLGGIVFAIVQS